MKYFVFGATYIVRLDAGEKIVETLLALCERDEIGAGLFNGLGAVSGAEIGHFDPAANDYTWIKISGPHEIVSLYGNITKVDGKPFTVRGGHLKEAVVSVTCEITLTRFRDDIGRTKDEATGFLRLFLEPGED
jgi:predicted DNA-binding protein with PD1-like motif